MNAIAVVTKRHRKRSILVSLLVGLFASGAILLGLSGTSGADPKAKPCAGAIARIDAFTSALQSGINEGSFDFDRDVGAMFDPELTWVLDGARGDPGLTAARDFLNGFAAQAESAGATVRASNTYHSCRALGSSAAVIVNTGHVQLTFPDGTSAELGSMITNVETRVGNRWIITHVHTEILQ